MDRFSRLEFDDDKSDGKISAGEAVRDASYFYKQALRYYLAGEYEIALRNFSRVLEKNNTMFEAWSGQILMLIQLGEYPEANTWADKALELFPEHPELFALKSIACCRDAKYDKALAYSDNALSKDNITSLVWLARAEVLFRRKNKIAENCISKAISIAGNMQPIIKLESARLLRINKLHSTAIIFLKEVVESMPKSALAWLELGYCQLQLGRKEQANLSLSQCLNLRPDWTLAEGLLRKTEKKSFWNFFKG